MLLQNKFHTSFCTSFVQVLSKLRTSFEQISYKFCTKIFTRIFSCELVQFDFYTIQEKTQPHTLHVLETIWQKGREEYASNT